MSIVLNESEWAKDMIQAKSLGSKPFETLCRVAKYYLNKNYSKSDTRKLLDTFVIQCDPTASLPKWSNTLDFAVSKAIKYNLVEIDSIVITEPEIERINALSGKQLKRLAFTLLCLAKYWDKVNPKCNYWVNNKDSEIMRLANINTSLKRQSAMYHELNKLEMIQFSKKVDNTNVRVCFVEDGEPEIHISDFRNLGYQYLKYCGEPYFECENCGITTKLDDKVGRKPKYCKSCAMEVHIKQTVNAVMKQRVNTIN